MPWQEASAVSLRLEFVSLASKEEANVRELCRRFGISPTTGYKWLERFVARDPDSLRDRSRRPKTSPGRSADELEARVLAIRDENPVWGGRKIRALLFREGRHAPSASTITAILRRHGRLSPGELTPRAFRRFEHAAPNELWQMDFKGHFAMREGRCHPLTIVDDHSRYSLCLRACADERGDTVKEALEQVFRCYGLPQRILTDNGSPWGRDFDCPHTALSAWLLRLDIEVAHGRPYHPQTQGKDERFHRTLVAEVLHDRVFEDLAKTQREFDRWQQKYNFVRPHESLGMATPAERYKPSPRAYPSTLPPIEYGPEDLVRKVQDQGIIYFRGRELRVPKAFRGMPVALRTTGTDGLYDVYFCRKRVSAVDLRKP